ncbi:unnamed protein product [Vitrella brassicaformis CCMP3155]|uniref:Uncharacterized protein n=1 Tax=Vitrella brassicaformis (strain CCMP3155) TaxID=1169540 RepID=A0A0G4EP02_VITBC|nr:unnamed protein product [Vitrella brassicaformis CCMP3155]|eukprot:CEL99154.1 unnamed protein product [Vitrella brassicaformis CCMP3155]
MEVHQADRVSPFVAFLVNTQEDMCGLICSFLVAKDLAALTTSCARCHEGLWCSAPFWHCFFAQLNIAPPSPLSSPILPPSPLSPPSSTSASSATHTPPLSPLREVVSASHLVGAGCGHYRHRVDAVGTDEPPDVYGQLFDTAKRYLRGLLGRDDPGLLHRFGNACLGLVRKYDSYDDHTQAAAEDMVWQISRRTDIFTRGHALEICRVFEDRKERRIIQKAMDHVAIIFLDSEESFDALLEHQYAMLAQQDRSPRTCEEALADMPSIHTPHT